MRKPYLLLAGAGYYPASGTGDWIGCFETQEEAEKQVETEERHSYYTKGKNKGQIKETFRYYTVLGRYGPVKVDWYEIVDLRDWCD